MSTVITAVDTERTIEHGVLIDLTLDDVTYYVSNCYNEITYDSRTYKPLAGFLTVSDIQSNIASTNDDIQLSLSAVPDQYITDILGQPIKGGAVTIYRAFFNYATQQVITGQVFKRFTGIITNFNFQEDLDPSSEQPTATHTITVIASSILGVLENKISGRRTNHSDYRVNWGERFFTANIINDASMDRVQDLYNANFDFGMPYKPQGSGVNNGSGAGGNGGQDQPFTQEA